MGHHRPDDRELTDVERQLIESVIPLVYRQARADTGMIRMPADDIAGEYFLALARSVHRYDPGRAKYTTFAVWILRGKRADLVRRQVQDSRISIVGQPTHWDDGTGANHPVCYDAVPGYEVTEIVAAAVGPEAAELLNYRYRDGMGYMEIADRAGTSRQSMRNRIDRILRKLKTDERLRRMINVGRGETGGKGEGDGKDG